MANPEHVEIVSQGAEATAEWQDEHPGKRLELDGADLSGVNLSGAILVDADLRGADLSRADLCRAFLSGASLGGANLSGADLREAVLFEAKLRGANLQGADLSGADLEDAHLTERDPLGAAIARVPGDTYPYLVSANLRGVNLSRAGLMNVDLTGADLREANLQGAFLIGATLHRAMLQGANTEQVMVFETTLVDVNLSDVRGLESWVHRGPSIVDERTLRKSWPLPEVFLRGCGLSNELIDFFNATLGKAVEFYSCFISYSTKDQAFAGRLYETLQDRGVRCWFAPRDLQIGARTRDVIDQSIRLHDKLLLILSKDSVDSQWVEQEIETALAKERKAKEGGRDRTVLFPIRVDDAVMDIERGWPALILNSRNIGDFRSWEEDAAFQDAFERLLCDLKAEEKAPPESA